MTSESAVVPDNSLQRLMSGLRPLLLLVGVAAAVAAGVGAVLWAQGPTYNMLYGSLSAEDTAQVTQALASAGIAYRLENGGGAVSVAADRVNDARLLLAGQGLPESGGGFANLAKDGGFGVSQFMEGARYQHALETELARTIASLQQVEGARVHIAAPRESSFIRERHPASASVFVQVKPGQQLASEQVTAIVNLVASSVPELEAQLVTVVDQKGRLLSSPQGRGEAAARDQQLEFARQMEQSYGQRIEALLAPLVGAGRVRAQVSAQFDMSATEEAREQYKPDSAVVRSEQTSEEQSRTGANGAAVGVPGALSNQPPERGVAQPPGSNPTVAGASPAADSNMATIPESSTKQATRNYEIDRTVAYTRNPAGRLKRVTVAVLVDNLRVVGKGGKVTEQPLPPAQLERITALVKDAIGFDAARGDSVNVLNAPWKGEPLISDQPLQSTPIWQQPIVLTIARIVAGLALALVVIFVVLRPTLRSLLAPFKAAMASASLSEAQSLAQPAANTAAAGLVGGSAGSAAGNTLAYEQQVAQARSLVAQDAGRVAQVVKTWVADGE